MQVLGQPVVNYDYYNNGWIENVRQIISGTEQKFNFTYDDGGRRERLKSFNGASLVTETIYGFDTASRLLEMKHLNSLNVELEVLNYLYDANSNRITMNRPSVTLPLPNPASNTSYNEANQMLSFNDKNITYDNNGNMASVTNSCGTTTYTWDVRNRLVGINGFNTDCSSLSASFKYDALNRRIEKTINGATTKYLYDGLDIIQELNQDGTVKANYIRGLNIDEPLARITQNAVRFYLTDALGSVIALTDENGVVKTTYSYDPFGNVTISGEASDNPFQYTGRENDGTGLYYYRARYYSPELQRFISEDPIGLMGGINKFLYVGNQPTRYNDPYGLIFGTLAAHALRLLGLATESTPVAGLITDTILGAALSIGGVEELPCGIEQKLGIPYHLIQGWGGVAGINLARIIATTSPSAGYALPIFLAGAGGWIIGDTINNIVKDVTGESISDYMAEGLYIIRQRYGY